MSSFTEPLVVEKISARFWMIKSSFVYHIGSKNSNEIVNVPSGFLTDFASVPRIFWILFPPDGEYTQAAVLHDYLYTKQLFKRSKCDSIFLEAMQVLLVPTWKRIVMYRAVRMFGWLVWDKKQRISLGWKSHTK